MRKPLFPTLLLPCLLLSTVTFADGVPHTFSSGEPAVASEMNENFQALVNSDDELGSRADNLDQRMDGLESQVRSEDYYKSFSMPFSPSGELRNVIVLLSEQSDGTKSYSIRMRYENVGGQPIIIDGEPLQRNYLAVYGSIQEDSDGNIFSVSKYFEGTDSTDYTDYITASIVYNPQTLAPTQNNDWRVINTNVFYNGTSRTVFYRSVEADFSSNNGQSESKLLYRHDYTVVESIDIANTMTDLNFNVPLLLMQTGTNSSRIRAQGIGTVEFMGVGNSKAIYYHVNGQVGGSLSGTPLVEGSSLYNLFFTQ